MSRHHPRATPSATQTRIERLHRHHAPERACAPPEVLQVVVLTDSASSSKRWRRSGKISDGLLTIGSDRRQFARPRTLPDDRFRQHPSVRGLPIAVAARRYFMAISERARPADKLIDLVIAIEALTDESDLEPQRKRLVQLLTGGVLADQKIRDDFTLIKYARNDIVHRGRIAPNADSLGGVARMYVDLAIHARVHEAIRSAADQVPST